jgi:hypothetical protein
VLLLDPKKQAAVLIDSFGKQGAKLFDTISGDTFELDTTRFLMHLNETSGAVIMAATRFVPTQLSVSLVLCCECALRVLPSGAIVAHTHFCHFQPTWSRSIQIDGVEKRPPTQFTDADIPEFVSFNISSDSLTFLVQNDDDDTIYDWIELDRAGVSKTTFEQDHTTITLQMQKGFDPAKITLPEGTKVRPPTQPSSNSACVRPANHVAG